MNHSDEAESTGWHQSMMRMRDVKSNPAQNLPAG